MEFIDKEIEKETEPTNKKVKKMIDRVDSGERDDFF